MIEAARNSNRAYIYTHPEVWKRAKFAKGQRALSCVFLRVESLPNAVEIDRSTNLCATCHPTWRRTGKAPYGVPHTPDLTRT
ncbi:hypothetical protein GCM10022255_102980 [Dactylosporangium darangshiense]|uniref:Uncharacterized protein n=1 Tax=Dactylosporangium darangshiense TaxID=579108 RepID=A0ABP8DSD6_9ACTN